MGTWLSCHGSGAIRIDEFLVVEVSNNGSTIKSTNENKHQGSIIFPIPSPPPGLTDASTIAVNLSSFGACVSKLSIMSGTHELWYENYLREQTGFERSLKTRGFQAEHAEHGLAVVLEGTFDNTSSYLCVQSVRIKFHVEQIKVESGIWNTSDKKKNNNNSHRNTVRTTNNNNSSSSSSSSSNNNNNNNKNNNAEDDPPRGKIPDFKNDLHVKYESTKVKFSAGFCKAPTVTIGITNVDASGGKPLRIKASATGVDASGFTMDIRAHKDTKLKVCSVSWMAVGF